MTQTFTATALVALVCATQAQADVTAREVWQAWSDGLGRADGATLETGAEEITDAAVRIEDAVWQLDGGNGTRTVARLGTVEMTTRDDGTVAVTLPDTIPVEVTAADGGRASFELQQTGQSLSVGGTAQAMRYDLSSDRLALALTEATDPDGTALDLAFRSTLNGIAATYGMQPEAGAGGIVVHDYNATAESLDLLAEGTDPESDAPFTVSGRLDRVRIDTDLDLPPSYDAGDTAAMLQAGFAAATDFGYDASAWIFRFGGESGPVEGTATTGAGGQTFDLSQAGLSVDGEVARITSDITSPDLPVPVRLSAERYGSELQLPVLPSETAEPFAVRYGLEALTLDDAVWALIDPQGAIARDPASLTIDLSGAARLDRSLFAEPPAGAESPLAGELRALDVNRIGLALAGATLDVTGGLTFDPDGPLATGGAPSPEGRLTVDLTGVNALIDGAIALGFVPADQAMMGRMMLGMFATQTGEDALQTVIEFTPDGRILANGQQVR